MNETIYASIYFVNMFLIIWFIDIFINQFSDYTIIKNITSNRLI